MSGSERLRVIFMGTPEFAVPSLNAILGAGYSVPLVVSVPDKPQGRGQKMRSSAVKQAALEAGLEVATPVSLKEPEFLEQIRSLAPDVICVVAFRILPESLYTIPSRGSFNLHGSLLPRYRGAAPIAHAIMNGDTETGVTTFFLQKQVDTGTIILQRSIPIHPEMTAGELHDTMMDVGAALVVETLRLIEVGDVHTTDQDDTLASPAPKIFREDCRIAWNRSASAIHNQIRALSPYPGAFTEHDGKNIKLLRSRIQDHPTLLLAPGAWHIVDSNRLFIGTGTGVLEILELQAEGRKAMTAVEFLRGYRPPQDSE